MSAQLLAVAPPRRGYQSTTQPASTAALPFVHRPKRGKRSNWHVPPTDDYGLACQIGREYAAHFIQFLKDNPFWVGSNRLGDIVADMDFKDESGAKGYWVGFFSHLERLIYASAQRIDVYADVDKVNAFYAEAVASGNLDSENEEE